MFSYPAFINPDLVSNAFKFKFVNVTQLLESKFLRIEFVMYAITKCESHFPDYSIIGNIFQVKEVTRDNTFSKYKLKYGVKLTICRSSNHKYRAR